MNKGNCHQTESAEKWSLNMWLADGYIVIYAKKKWFALFHFLLNNVRYLFRKYNVQPMFYLISKEHPGKQNPCDWRVYMGENKVFNYEKTSDLQEIRPEKIIVHKNYSKYLCKCVKM